MNTIYRAWDKKDKKMIYDADDLFGIITNKGVMILNPLNKKSEYSFMDKNRFNIMQNTGLKDKKGNDIYEEDLLDFDLNEWGADFIPEIIKMNKIIGKWEYCGTISDIKSWRAVIGNIYENPEYEKK